MLAAIDFDDETLCKASEVGHIGAQRDLPPKSITVQLLAAEQKPELLLGAGQPST